MDSLRKTGSSTGTLHFLIEDPAKCNPVKCYRAIVFSNTILSMTAILKAMKTLEIRLEDPGLQITMNEFLDCVQSEANVVLLARSNLLLSFLHSVHGFSQPVYYKAP